MLTELRTGKKMTQEDLAHALGYHPSYIGQMERDRKIPTLRTMVNIAQIFEMPVSDLMRMVEKLQTR